jgi:uncharacterized membrane protein YedE/YeeE
VETFTPLSSLLGGALIGLAASVLLLVHGRVAGIAGILGETLRGEGTRGEGVFRGAFLLGLFAAGLGVRLLYPAAFAPAGLPSAPGIALVVAAGLLVGYGTRLGNGCTSGHGVCGLSRLSKRSLAATLTFMAAGGVAVFVVRHVLGGGAR